MTSLKEVTSSSTRPPPPISSSSSSHNQDKIKIKRESKHDSYDSLCCENMRLSPIEFIYRYTGIVDISVAFDFSAAKVMLAVLLYYGL